MKLGTQNRSSSLIINMIWWATSEVAVYQHSTEVTTLKNFKSHKNVMESFFKIKTFKSLKELMESFFIIKNFKSPKKAMQSFFSIKHFES